MQPEEALLRVAAEALGPCRFGADLSWDHGESVVREIVAGDGTVHIGKAHRRAVKFATELHAYRSWVPALEPWAPRLLVADEPSQVMILTKVPGRPVPDDGDAAIHQSAGEMLRRFHDAGPAMPGGEYVETERRRLESWLERARPGLLTEGEIAIARHALEFLAAAPKPVLVPCHCDWQPRNWLVDDTGSLHVIDFEHARLWPWWADITRLWSGEWSRHPLLAEAFFAGYGRTLDPAEERCLLASSAIGHLITIVWADEHHDPAYGAAARTHLGTLDW